MSEVAVRIRTRSGGVSYRFVCMTIVYMWAGSPNWQSYNSQILHFFKNGNLFSEEHIWTFGTVATVYVATGGVPSCFRVFSDMKKLCGMKFSCFGVFSPQYCTLDTTGGRVGHRGISMDLEGIWWILEISWNLQVRSRRACPSSVAQDSFFPRKRTFQRRLKKFELNFLYFSPLSSRFGAVKITRTDVNTISKMLKIVENQWFWWIFMISWYLIVRSRRACPSRVAQDSFSLGNERFRGVWKSLK